MLYIFIYNPPIAGLPLMPIEILLLLGLVYLTAFNKWLKMLAIFKKEIVLYLAIIMFCFIREFGSIQSVFFKANVFFFLQSIVLPYFLIDLYSRFTSHKNLFKDIILIGAISSFFTILMIFIPSFGEFVRYKFLKTDDFTDLIAFRSFGISEGLTFAYGTAQGLIFALVLYYAKVNPKYYYLLPFILLSIIFNARIGMVPVIFSLLYFVVVKFNLRFILIIILFSIIIYLIIFNTSLFAGYTETIEWAFDFFTQSSDFLSGNDSASSNTFDTLFGKMSVFPNNAWGWIIGTGENIFLAPQDNSDIGYIIQLNYGGLVYLTLLFSLIGYMMFRLKFIYKANKWLVFLLITTILLTNVKGLFISIIPSFRLLALIYAYLIFEYRKFKQTGGEDFDFYSFSNPKSLKDNEPTRR
ncbi:hypothetical protein [Pedobacter jamesrossensis]|uniref:O-antigen ligase like membrane protein n=1 Tax=Pedobacter jamesrossensis TaxID=1908238 RepID=A0ABV8NKA3_9SPHI